MKSLINDGGNFSFENGTVVTTCSRICSYIEQDYQKTIKMVLNGVGTLITPLQHM